MKHFAAAITVLLLTGCVSQYEATFPPSETSAEPVSLHVTPVLQQEELEVQVIIQDSSATAGQYGLIGALVGAAIDASINNSRAKKAERRAEVIRNNTINLDLYGQLADTTRIEAAGGTWELVAVDDVTTDIDLSPRINDILESGDVDAVVAMTASYKLTPALDQIAVRVVQAVYPRDGAVSSKGKRRPSSTRAFTYLSPQRPLQYRPFNDGEFERIEARIRDEYAQQISMEPGKADALTKAMEKEIEELAESGQIPEDIAMAETWGAALIEIYLEDARRHIRYMVEHDWNDAVPAELVNAELTRFPAVVASGLTTQLKGEPVTELDENVIYRTFTGDMYSVPAAAQ